MTILERTRATATHRNRARQVRAELRLEEIIKVDGIADDYSVIDRRGDLEMERRFATLYALVNSDEEKEAVAAAFSTWMRTERDEEVEVQRTVNAASRLMKRNNPTFIDGAYVPADSDGAA